MPMPKPSPFGIEWQNVQRDIATLEPYELNPRNLTKRGMKALRQSFETLGMAQLILCNPDGLVIDGHARLKVLQQMGVKGQIEVRQATRPLTLQEYRAALIYLNAEFQEWDLDKISNEYEVEELRDMAFPERLLPSPPEIGSGEDLPTESETTAAEDAPAYQVVLTCRTAKEQAALMTKLAGMGLKPQAVKV